MTDYANLPAREIERQSRNIRPGEWAIERQRPISTLLGSCVAVCLYDSALPIGGMNHFMLPQMQRHAFGDMDILLAGDACMEALLNALLAQGAAKHRIRAKAFGGGAILQTTSQPITVGKRNVDFTQEWLERERIPLVTSDFLGPWARKILFVPGNSDAWCRRMPTAAAVEREERAYAESLQKKSGADTAKKVELF